VTKADIGVLGLAVMGSNLALNLADHGFKVSGFNREADMTKDFVAKHPHDNFTPTYSLQEFVDSLTKPRVILIMIMAGDPVDQVISQLEPLLDPGDIIIDGGNSYFEDTIRREKALSAKGIYYFGTGVSGGEKGARNGPAIMPGGDREVYQKYVARFLEAIAAKAYDGRPCCTYIGPNGAGHYVKMVHNGIEYADMQLIAEAYLLLKYIGGYSNAEIADIFREWNKGKLKSYLIGITADILTEKDDLTEGYLVDAILDSAGQKGTGQWTSLEALKLGVDTSIITAACNARVMSNQVARRSAAKELFRAPVISQPMDKARESFKRHVEAGLYAAKIVAYAQGFELLKTASDKYGWGLSYGDIAAIWRAGCIIQAQFLDDITNAFKKNPDLGNLMMDDFFRQGISDSEYSLRSIAVQALRGGVPIPAMSAAIAYLDAFRGAPVGANLIQAQRDFFGAHTFERNDRDGVFHHEWDHKA